MNPEVYRYSLIILAATASVCSVGALPTTSALRTSHTISTAAASTNSGSGSGSGSSSGTSSLRRGMTATAGSPCTISSEAEVTSSSSLDHVAAASRVADRFKARQYRAPWWAREGHSSTIFGSGEIQKKFGRLGPQVQYRRERWDTPDGDFIDVDFLDTPYGSSSGSGERGQTPDDSAPFAVLTHGLESTSTAPLTARMALAFQRKGFRVAVMCFRSCSGEDNRTLKAYHMGFTEDLELVCKTLRERHPKANLFLSGFSLGGNVITKFMGELGDGARELGIMGGAVTCVPMDPASCQPRVDTGFGKLAYASNFLKTLIPKIMRKAEKDPRVAELVDIERFQKISTIGEFDDMIIAPFFGFDDFQDYYRKCGGKQFLKDVKVPLLVLQALNDPFMDPVKNNPTPDDLQGAPVRLSYQEHGGHCAFVVEDQEENDKGWLATELARFGEHVANHRPQEDGAAPIS